ncbi:hypothetical protein FNB15_03555 [Ferrovibrio terrae]|uniref:Nucleoid-associated protein n=2 Tax=Ferrovibrio terrae TaxID=2594003 RepID=A0A516H796_9PROT|nr:hypothetical protein FNB15_03555 [Ferrovibrio terrae]
MGFLTEEENRSLRIRSMILHVVGGEADFEPKEARDVVHDEFFINRIRDTDVAPIFQFKDDSGTRDQLVAMAGNPVTFEAGAQALSRQFSLLHVTASRDGAFFIFELECDVPGVTIYSLIKYDYREAIEQDDAEGNLRRIVHAFTDDKRSIQKAALIRVVNAAADPMVSATDRVRPSPEISDYFERFLGVKRSRSDQELSTAVKELLRKTLSEFQDVLPGRDVAGAITRAVGNLRDRHQITEEAIGEAIIAAAGAPDDEDLRVRMQNRVLKKMQQMKLDGLAFRPDRNVLRRPPQRKVRTAEGVILIYPDEGAEGTVERNRRPDGSETITIRTARIEEDTVVRDSTRRIA